MITTVLIDITLSAVIRSCGHNGSHWHHTLSCHQKLGRNGSHWYITLSFHLKLWSLRFSLISYSQLSSEAVVITVLIDIILSAVIRSWGHNGSHRHHTLSFHLKLCWQRFSWFSLTWYSQLSSKTGVITVLIDIISQLSSEAVVRTVLIGTILSAVIRSSGHNGSHWHHTLSCHQKLWS